MLSTPDILLPTDEAERLETLHYYDILQSLQEEVFDELAALAARIFNLPIAYISLMDRDEAAYKATFGFPLLPPQPRANMLCALVVKENQVVVYHDLAAVAPTPLNGAAIQNALANQARFYAGAPLRMGGQHSIGTLCVVDQRPRSFSSAEQDVLDRLADVVSLTIAVRHLSLHEDDYGSDRWQTLQAQLRDEVYALGALVRYLTTRYGTQVPVAEDVLQPIVRRLNDLRDLLKDYQEG